MEPLHRTGDWGNILGLWFLSMAIRRALLQAAASRQQPPVLQAHDLCKAYQMGDVTVNALRNINVTVHRAEFVAVMGPSGSGKSTLLYLLGGLDQPSSGEIILSGQQLSQLHDDELALMRRRKIGFIFQFYNLIPTLTAAENVALPLIIDGRDIRQYQGRIDSLLQLVGLWARRNHKPDQLSGGQQQRVAIARALVNDPTIVLGDEPTGNLDSRTGAEILALMRRSCDELGQTIVMVTHDIKAASYADRIIFLKDGMVADELRVDSTGEVSEILRRFAALEDNNGIA